MDSLCEVWSLKEAGQRCSMTSSPVSFVLCLSLSLCALHSRTRSDVVSELGVSLFCFVFFTLTGSLLLPSVFYAAELTVLVDPGVGCRVTAGTGTQ